MSHEPPRRVMIMPRPASTSILGWPPAGWLFVLGLTLGLLGLNAATLTEAGMTDDALGIVARRSVRVAFACFALAFTLGPLTRWLARRGQPNAAGWRAARPFLGVSFALSQLAFFASHVLRVIYVHDGDFLSFRSMARSAAS